MTCLFIMALIYVNRRIVRNYLSKAISLPLFDELLRDLVSKEIELVVIRQPLNQDVTNWTSNEMVKIKRHLKSLIDKDQNKTINKSDLKTLLEKYK